MCGILAESEPTYKRVDAREQKQQEKNGAEFGAQLGKICKSIKGLGVRFLVRDGM